MNKEIINIGIDVSIVGILFSTILTLIYKDIGFILLGIMGIINCMIFCITISLIYKGGEDK